MKRLLRFCFTALLSVVILAGCEGGSGGGNNDNTSDTGTTQVTATITGPASSKAGRLSKAAAIPSQAASVTIEVKTPDCSGTSVYNTKMDTAGQTSVAFNFTLTAGSTACFTAGAYSGAGGTGTLLYQGSTSGINLVAGESVNVEVSLSEVGAVEPTATTGAATSIGATSATLNAAINPNGFETTAYFEWGLDTTYGNKTLIQTVGAGTANVSISQSITGLTAATTYHYRAVANNSGNTVYGSDQSFTNTTESGVTVTFPATSAPTATTNAATSVTGTGATLNATVNPQGSATTAYFEWGTTTSYGNTTPWQDAGNGTTDTTVSAALTGLTTGTTYHYRVVAYNAHGLTTGADGMVGAPTTANTWATKASMPLARGASVAGVIGNTLYVAGGFDGTDKADLQAYDASTNTWTALASMPQGRYQGSGGVINGILYVAGGWDNTYSWLPHNNLWAYNPATNTWDTLANMPTLSGCGTAGVINGKLYVTTPCDGYSGYKKLFHVYDPATNAWTALASSTNTHVEAASGVINGKFYVVGGYDEYFDARTNALDMYNPATDTWTTLAPAPTARQAASGVTLNGKLYVMGGFDGAGNVYNSVDVYDPATNTWSTETATMPTPRYSMAAVAVNGSIYAIGGNNSSGTILTTNEAYTP